MNRLDMMNQTSLKIFNLNFELIRVLSMRSFLFIFLIKGCISSGFVYIAPYIIFCRESL